MPREPFFHILQRRSIIAHQIELKGVATKKLFLLRTEAWRLSRAKLFMPEYDRLSFFAYQQIQIIWRTDMQIYLHWNIICRYTIILADTTDICRYKRLSADMAVISLYAHAYQHVILKHLNIDLSRYICRFGCYLQIKYLSADIPHICRYADMGKICQISICRYIGRYIGIFYRQIGLSVVL